MHRNIIFLMAVFILGNAAPAAAGAYAGRKILYVDSYHTGYEHSEGTLKGVRTVLQDTRVELRTVYMDTKRNPAEDFGREAALMVKRTIETFRPDVVIAADDGASEFLVMPHYKNAALPIVFCGVNWDASVYGYPYRNATGMVEVDLVPQQLGHMRRYARGERVGYLSVDSLVEQKNTKAYNERFCDDRMKVALVKTYEQFKAAFLQLQEQVDMLFISNYAGIDRWDEAEAKVFIMTNTRIPTAARNDWMAPYALITLCKLPEEQGEWAAATTLRILDGTPPSAIPIATNHKGRLIINLAIAAKLGIVFDQALLRTAEIIGTP
ncbi:MAG: ABC transporter substrate binding protein [Desulfatitalea sp.]